MIQLINYLINLFIQPDPDPKSVPGTLDMKGDYTMGGTSVITGCHTYEFTHRANSE